MKRIYGPLLEINLSSAEQNYKYIKSILDPDTQVAAVVKSDAYGLGLIPVANRLFDAGCELFFVANLDEALRLRSAGLEASIVVFDDDFANAQDLYCAANLIAVVNNINDLDIVQHASSAIPYFVNVETGFSRFGLDIASLHELRLAGVFDLKPPCGLLSHLACSDDAQSLTNEKQRDRFIEACKLFPDKPRSLIASAGVWLARSYHFDIARIGSAIYGLNNARIQPNPLKPVVRLFAPVLDIHDVPSGETIGYGATYHTDRVTCVGIVGIGYKHGLPWSCANKIKVRIGNSMALVIGRISMEYTTIDLTDVPEALRKRGTVVDFLYAGFGIDELASAAGVNGQEILVRLGSACPRIYSRTEKETAVSFSAPCRNGSHALEIH